jgi:ankyrin repeat protein
VPHTPRGESPTEREDGSAVTLSPSNDSSRGNAVNVNLANPDVIAAQINVLEETMRRCNSFMTLLAKARPPMKPTSVWSAYLEIAKFIVAGKHGTPFQLVEGSTEFATALLVLRLSFFNEHLQLKDLLQKRPKIANNDLWTALPLTCRGNHYQAATVLLSHSAKPVWRDGTRESCLLEASLHNSDQVVRVLLESGVDVNTTDYFGDTSWSSICRLQSHDAVASVLSDAGANKNANGPGNLNPLCLAAAFGQVDQVRVMLKRGMNPSHGTFHGWYPLVSRICAPI